MIRWIRKIFTRERRHGAVFFETFNNEERDLLTAKIEGLVSWRRDVYLSVENAAGVEVLIPERYVNFIIFDERVEVSDAEIAEFLKRAGSQ